MRWLRHSSSSNTSSRGRSSRGSSCLARTRQMRGQKSNSLDASTIRRMSLSKDLAHLACGQISPSQRQHASHPVAPALPPRHQQPARRQLGPCRLATSQISLPTMLPMPPQSLSATPLLTLPTFLMSTLLLTLAVSQLVATTSWWPKETQVVGSLALHPVLQPQTLLRRTLQLRDCLPLRRARSPSNKITHS